LTNLRRIMDANGSHFDETIKALGLTDKQEVDARRNASDIVGGIIAAYGATTDGNLDANRIPNAPITGLVYGRIQSGKTRAMIARRCVPLWRFAKTQPPCSARVEVRRNRFDI
jgi:hypothetical protein